MMDGRLSSFLSVNTFASSTACRPISKKSSRYLLLWAAKDVARLKVGTTIGTSCNEGQHLG